MKEDDVAKDYVNSSEGNMPDDQMIDDMFRAKTTVHADDAVDYEDIDELAEDLPVDVAEEGDMTKDDGEDELQQQADNDFDNMFGDDIGGDGDMFDPENNRLLEGGLDNSHLLENDGLDIGGIYGDEDTQVQPQQPQTQTQTQPQPQIQLQHQSQPDVNRKRKQKSQDSRQRKRQKLQLQVQKLEKLQMKRNLRYHYPNFRSDKPFNNHLLFLPDPRYYTYSVPNIAHRPKSLVPNKVSLELSSDQRKSFKSHKNLQPDTLPNVTNITDFDLRLIDKISESGLESKQLVPLPYLTQDGSNDNQFSGYGNDLILVSADWDDDAIINAGDNSNNKKMVNLDQDKINFDFNGGSDQEDEEDENIFNGKIDTDSIKLDMNDPNLLFEKTKSIDNDKKAKALSMVPFNEKLIRNKFNISNDKQYEIFKKNYNTKIRSQIGNLNIEHSVPAMRLQSPFYKVRLPKDEARCFHRPKFNPRPGTLITFSKMKPRKKKKDKGKSSQELFAKTSDLTTTDSSTLIGMEYSEEYPMILSNFGMGSKLINYYRKEKEDDNSRPKAPLGETHVLGVEDRSPFWNFGYVAKGDFVPTLYNNMTRAPIFKHEQKNTDFLLVKSQGAGHHQRYFLRNINHLFAVGQTFPSVEIPAPHSRKVTNTSKNRLRMVVFRTMNKKGKARISVRDISHHFPDQNDMQNRQRLKEFMEYQRQGEDQGFWKIKNRDTVPTEESIRMMITPEDVSLLDSMQSGQQSLEDLSILFNDEQEKVKKEKMAKIEAEADEGNSDKKDKDKDKKKEIDEEGIDEQLTGWNLSRNFVISNQTKSMLQLNGEGDHTGIGIGFSLLRTSQKHTFSPLFAPPKENVPKSNQASYQQRLYEEEVSRIWYSQRRSLTVDANESKHNLDNIYSEYRPLNHKSTLKHKYLASNSDFNKKNQILRISRRFRDENGIVQRRTEVIKDPRLIKAYIRRKKQIEDYLIMNTDLEDIVPTNDKELNKIRRKALEEKLANLERRAKHNKGRRPSKDPLHVAAAKGGKVIDANTVVLPSGDFAIGGKGIGKGKSKTRRCAACGAFGHIRTKKSCPLYHQTQGGTIDINSSEPGSLPPPPPPPEAGGI